MPLQNWTHLESPVSSASQVRGSWVWLLGDYASGTVLLICGPGDETGHYLRAHLRRCPGNRCETAARVAPAPVEKGATGGWAVTGASRRSGALTIRPQRGSPGITPCGSCFCSLGSWLCPLNLSQPDSCPWKCRVLKTSSRCISSWSYFDQNKSLKNPVDFP